ncbi:MAG: DUF3574 domain-containing protein [Limisphaerales bacterium]
MRFPNRLPPALLAAALLATGCRSAGPAAGDAQPKRPMTWTRTELYFGAVEKPGWDEYLAASVTPRFPDGFTVLEAEGQWRNPQGEIRRIPTRVLLILHPPTPAANAAIEALRTEFLARFGHVSVLRGSGQVQVSF